SIASVNCVSRLPTSFGPISAVRSPIGSVFQFSALAFATSRLNWSCPLKIVLDGNRDSNANAAEQIKNTETTIFQLRISPTLNAEFTYEQPHSRCRGRVPSPPGSPRYGSRSTHVAKSFTSLEGLYILLGCADSFRKKKPEECCSPDVARWGAYKAFHPRPIASTTGLAQAQFSHQRPDPFAFYKARWRLRAASISEDPRRRDLHHLYRTRFVSRANSRS